MANNVTNHLHITGDETEIKLLLKAIHSDAESDCVIDFNNIIPVPYALKNTEYGELTHFSICAYLYAACEWHPHICGIQKLTHEEYINLFQMINAHDCTILRYMDLYNFDQVMEQFDSYGYESVKDMIEAGSEYISNLKKYGAFSWYDFCREHWGTSGSAYCTKLESDNHLVFYTAWYAPIPVIEKLSNLYPNLKFDHYWFCDGNVGRMLYESGEVIFTYNPQPGSVAEHAFIRDVWKDDWEGDTYEAES